MVTETQWVNWTETRKVTGGPWGRSRKVWTSIKVLPQDERLFVLRSRDGQCFFAAFDYTWRTYTFETATYTDGPFATCQEALAKARLWFLDNPSGYTAQLLAKPNCDPNARAVLRAMNQGDETAIVALTDLASDMGIVTRETDDPDCWRSPPERNTNFWLSLTAELDKLGIMPMDITPHDLDDFDEDELP